MLASGDLRVGDELKLTARPNPDWTLKRVGDLVYGNAEVDMVPNGWVNFAGTDEEMDALIALPELAEGEWRHVLTERKAGRVSYY